MLTNNGSDLYGGEAVTQTQHALQCTTLAEEKSAEAELITASLLHDIGHLLEPEFETAHHGEEDMVHEDLGEVFSGAVVQSSCYSASQTSCGSKTLPVCNKRILFLETVSSIGAFTEAAGAVQ